MLRTVLTREAIEDCFLLASHHLRLFRFGVVIAEQVKRPMHYQKGYFLVKGFAVLRSLPHGTFIGDYNLAQVQDAVGRRDEGLVSFGAKSEGENVGGRVYAAMLPVQLVHLSITSDDQADLDVVANCLFVQDSQDSSSQPTAVDLALERPSDACGDLPFRCHGNDIITRRRELPQQIAQKNLDLS